MGITDFIPQSEGWLPSWQLFIAATSLFNTVQNFAGIKLTRHLYGGSALGISSYCISRAVNAHHKLVNPLQARTFAIWTLTTSIVRGYAAYNLHLKPIYDIALLTYLLAFAHFTSEVLIFRSVKFTPPLIAPMLVATSSLAWMIMQYDFYVKS
ncbi:transmembrane domain-containing protein [Moniliophthora roreri MCA 2997]|uniref:Transmembrane domain-containing protein n=1 Tax=Moniliophthora roreri (strain MCA 2997) TaxID=1381753 RepID=V2X8C0_MONRO|nr:transmembrane domain-containing protein [Moniliophthora roreri MCA 2997]